jgi:Ulp1 family protease
VSDDTDQDGPRPKRPKLGHKKKASKPKPKKTPTATLTSTDSEHEKPSAAPKKKPAPKRKQSKGSSAASSKKHPLIEFTTSDSDDKSASTSRPSKTAAVPSSSSTVLIYPYDQPGGVSITRGDLDRTEETRWWNDVVVEFGFRFAIEGYRSDPALQEMGRSILFFNSFLYSKLALKPKNW